MHTFNGKSCTIFHNGDMSGNLIIAKDNVEIKIDSQDILDLVAEYIRQEKISKLEQMETNELLNL